MRKLLLLLSMTALFASCGSNALNSLWKEMPLSSCTNSQMLHEQINALPAEWQAAYDFLKNEDLGSLPLGRVDLTANGTYANVQEYETKSSADFEAHQAYVDVQVVVSGREIIKWAPLSKLGGQTGPYSQENDIVFFSTASESEDIMADRDCIAVFFPEDGHKPGMSLPEGSQKVRKIVVKIPFAK